MPYFVVENIIEAMSQQGKALCGSRVLVLGLSYKRDIDDLRESPSLTAIGAYHKRARASPASITSSTTATSVQAADASTTLNAAQHAARMVIPKFDCVVIVFDHSQYNIRALYPKQNRWADLRNAKKHMTLRQRSLFTRC